MISVIFTEAAIAYLDDLISTLLKEEYFSFKETADEYVDDLVNFVVLKISTTPKRIAPPQGLKSLGNSFDILNTKETNILPGTFSLFRKENDL